jgi:hypothetical protein
VAVRLEDPIKTLARLVCRGLSSVPGSHLRFTGYRFNRKEVTNAASRFRKDRSVGNA